ncbi:MAG TPA: hemagglutinin repeat-containing protein, partial [Paraburkholderia sp.]
MKKNNCQLVYSRLRNTPVAVEQTATVTGKDSGQITVCGHAPVAARAARFPLHQIAFAALVLPGMVPACAEAQIAPTGPSGPSVVQTQNGLPQVNINRPSGAGVSLNTYGQFDVQRSGAILNNSPAIVQTQQAGMINGNPNFGANQSAKIIVNQVNSRAASQINGYVEVAGKRAEVVIANGSGISVNGGGFINTSRAVLTTGTPNFAPDGSLTGFNVTGGNITVQGAGLNAGNVDQVDLIARAVQINAAIYAKNLNVVAGANRVDHDTLAAAPIAADGPVPDVSIDVSQLGGMYANRIFLASNEYGVGVSTRGVLAAQAGDLILTAQGKLVLAGQTSASGNVALAARDGLDNSGTTYAQQNVSANTLGALTNSGTLAAQQNTTINAGRVASTGTLGAGIDGDGSVSQSGELNVSTGGALAATGRNAAGGGATLRGASVDLSGSDTSANGTLTLGATGGDLNLSGATATAGGALVATAAGTLASDSSTLRALGDATIHAQTFDNHAGNVSAGGALTATATGTLNNKGGTLSTNGAHGTVNVTAASIDNTDGTLTNAGDGAMTISSAGVVTNTGGTLGGNGDVTLNAQTLSNDKGAQLVASGAANLNVKQSVNNAGGTLYGGTALNLNQAGAAVINDGGVILAGLDVSVAGVSLSNAGGAIRASRDIAVSGAVSGDGEMTAGRNLSLAVNGDYTNGAANTLHADGDMSVSATGTLTNTGTLAAAGALTASGAHIVNAAGADINSSSTTVKAAGTLVNAGRIEGDTVTTHSSTLVNTGTLIGNNVQLFATDLQNTGAQAVLAGAQFVGLYASNSVMNADGALIYSAGNLEIAKDGTRDSAGLLANQVNTLTNSAANIEADGDIDIAARTLNNVRTGVVTQAGTPQPGASATLTLWTNGLGGDDLGFYRSLLYPQWNWRTSALGTGTVGHLMQPITVQVPKSQVTNLDSGAQSFSLTQPLIDRYIDSKTAFAQPVCDADGACTLPPSTRTITNNPTQYYERLTDNGDTYSITFWPDYDPAKNMRPDSVQVNYSLGPDNHDYVEVSRTTSTTIATDQLVNAGNAATIQAQGAIRINADGGAISNQSSTIAAGGDLVRRATGGTVSDTGTVLQQRITETDSSTFTWHQKTSGDSDTQSPPATITQSVTTVDALPAIASSNQTVQIDAQTISIGSVNRQGQTVSGSGVTGGDAGGLQTVAPALMLPVNGLYSLRSAPDASYLIATDPRFMQYSRFISSDYMLGQLGVDPQKTVKRLGDGLYEAKLIRDQVTQLTGRTFLAGFANGLDEYTALMDNGVAYAKAFGLEPGIGLSAAQMQQLTTDMVWLVSQDVTLPDGSHQSVLVPQLYLAQSSTIDLTHSGAIVAGNAVSLKATGDVNNSGHVVSDVATTVLGNSIVNRGVMGSAGTTTVAAVQDVRNVSGRIGGSDVLVQAGRDVVNETATFGVAQSFGSNTLAGSVTGTGVDAIGTISATRSATVIAGRDVNLTGATIQSGGSAAIGAGRDINVGTTTLTATQDYGTKDSLNGSHTSVTQNLGSSIVTGADLVMVSGRDTTLTGATIQATGNATLIAGSNLTVIAAKDTQTHSEQSMGGKRSQYRSSSYDEAVQGSSINAGGNVTLAAGQKGGGSLAILGSNVTTGSAGGAVAGGAVNLVATGDVTIGAVTETHDAQNWSHMNHSGFLSKETTTDTTRSHLVIANGSTVAGDTVTVNAGHDLSVTGSTVAATHDVLLAAANNLHINTSQDISGSSLFHQETKSGLGSTGGAGISYGSRDQKDTTHDSAVTQNGSLIGSTDGSVHLAAGNDLHVIGSDLIAARDITGTGANVTIDTATGQAHHDETHEVKQSGFTLAVKAPVLDALQNTVQQSKASGQSQDGRAAALHGIAAASAAWDANMAAGGLVSDLSAGRMPQGKIELSWGTSQSKSTFTEDQTTHRGSNVSAGGTAAFVATGSGQAGNVTIAGSSVNANDVILAAKNQVNLVNTTDADSTRSANQSSSASVGVSYGTQGFGVSASMSKAHGDANSDAAMQNNTHVSGANSVSIVSGGDTNIVGANVNGNHVSAEVGGNLNLASVQDTTTSGAHQSSTGGGFSVSQGGGSASFSHSSGSANGSYAGVNEQAGIQAGT